MATIKCENCGTMIETNGNDATVLCHNCGTKCEPPVIGNNAFLKRGFLALEDGEWTKAKEFFEQSLNTDPECGDSYLGLLMAELKVKTKDDLKNCQKPFDNNNNYSKIIRFGSPELKADLEGYIDYINTRNQAEDVEKDYLVASKVANSSKNPNKLRKANKTLIALGDYKDSAELAALCIEKAKIYTEKAEKRETRTIKIASLSSSAIALLIILTIVVTTVIVPAIKYNKATKLIEKEEYVEAFDILVDLGNYKDSSTIISENIIHIFKGNTIGADYEHTFAVKDDGTVQVTTYEERSGYYYYYYSDHYCDQCALDDWENIVAISVGSNVTAGLTSDAKVTTTDSDINIYSDNIISIAAGGNHVVALKADGTVVADGDTYDDQCDVEEWEDIIAIAAGYEHTVGLKSDGTVVATGDNYYNQCDVEGWDDIIAIAAGDDCTVGLKADGTVVATGNNSDEQCDVYGWKDIVAIATSGYHTVGLKSDGTLVATGNNLNGECDVSKMKDIVAIATGSNNTLGLKADGTLVVIGDNDYNQCNVNDWKNIKLPQ